ncbi:MAG: HSP20 family protein [Salibacteraceae bacterium]|jgi:HSP20 family protein
MIYPDIRTYRESRWAHRFTPLSQRRFFLGQNYADLMLKQRKPAFNIKQDETHFELEIVIPGFSKEEIQITVFDDILTVRGEKEVSEKPNSPYVLEEFDIDMVERKFRLAEGLGTEKITESYENGILKLHFKNAPNTAEEANRR